MKSVAQKPVQQKITTRKLAQAPAPSGKKKVSEQLPGVLSDAYEGAMIGAKYAKTKTASKPAAAAGAPKAAVPKVTPKTAPHVPLAQISDGAMRALRHAGKATVAVGLAFDALDVWRSAERDRARGDGEHIELKKAAGRVAGGWIGAGSGALAGAAIGSVVPGVGTAIGGVVGGMIGAVSAGIGGSIAGERLMSP